MIRRVLAVAITLLCPGIAAPDSYEVRVSALPGGLFRVAGESVLLDAPTCVRPAIGAPAQLDVAARTLTFPKARLVCRVDRLLRPVAPPAGLYDLRVTERAPDLFDTRLDGWLIATADCPVPARETPARIVIDGRGDRILLTAPDHPRASITGRVTCRIRQVLTEVSF